MTQLFKVTRFVLSFFIPLLVLPLFAFSSIVQTDRTDSLKIALGKAKEDTNKLNTLNNLAWEVRIFNPDTSIFLSNQVLKLGFNMLIALCISPLHAFFEEKMKGGFFDFAVTSIDKGA